MRSDILLLMPTLTVLIGALVLMFLSPVKRIELRTHAIVALIFLGIALGLNISFLGESYSFYAVPEYFNKYVVVDNYSTIFSIVILACTMLTILMSGAYLHKNKFFPKEMFCLILFTVFGMMILLMSYELITTFIALEVASLAVYILVGLNRFNIKAVEAIFKYIFLSSFIGAFFVFGTVLVYSGIQSTQFADIAHFFTLNNLLDHKIVLVGFIFITVAIMFKLSAFPFHAWSIDVYWGASLPITTFVASTFKLAIFGFSLRFLLIDFKLFEEFWGNFFAIGALATMVIGSLITVGQSDVKRMFITSSIVHTGYMLIALASISLTNTEAVTAILFYLLAYAITAIGAFGLLSYISFDENRTILYQDFKGLATNRPYLAACMTIFLLSFAGFPSTIGFLAKFHIFLGAVSSGLTLLLIVAIISAFISVYYYFKLIIMMYFYPPKRVSTKKRPWNMTAAVIMVLAFVTVWGGIGNEIIPFFPGATTFIELAKESTNSLLFEPKMPY